MVNEDREPSDSEQSALSTKSGNMTTRQAVERFIPNRDCINAMDTSAKDMVDVRAATSNRVKNKMDQNCVHGIDRKSVV